MNVQSVPGRGAGCIFVEMISGLALFPGIKDNVDQLNKIWQVSSACIIFLPTNTFVL